MATQFSHRVQPGKVEARPHSAPLYSVSSPVYQLSPGLVAALMILTVTTYSIYKDYKAFLNLGPGGTPHTFLGYLRVAFLRLFAIRNPCEPGPMASTLSRPLRGLLPEPFSKLPRRLGGRPEVTGIAPHRQTTQKGSAKDFAALAAEIKALARSYPALLCLGTSCFEKHGTGLFSRSPLNRTCNGEICHAHPSDGSLHMTLHPQDARIVLERGWGERHPLARGGWLSRFVPIGFVMVYAPRDADELEAVMGIIRAAIWWVGGQTLDLPAVEEPPSDCLRDG